MRFITALMVFFATGVCAQLHDQKVIKGKVTDGETHSPLENAVVFLANTACGTSTGIDGSFILSNVVQGEYDIVIACVGYSRQTKHIQVGTSDTSSLSFALIPRPIPISEEVVLGEQSNNAKPNLDLFFPESKDEAFCLYGSETAIPIGILLTDSALYMYSFEPTLIDSERYFRLWLLIFNTSEAPIEFDALHAVKLDIRKLKTSYHNILPDLPDAKLREVQDTTTRRIVSKTVGYTLEVVGKQRIIFVSAMTRFEGGKSWLGVNAPAEVLGGVNPQRLWEIYIGSMYGGILKHYRIFPKTGVHGYIYFPSPGLNWQASTNWFKEAFAYQYSLTIQTPSGDKQIVFTAR